MSPLTQDLIQAFTQAEEEIKSVLPSCTPVLRIYIQRIGHNLKLEYEVYNSGYYPNDAVEGKVLYDVVLEYLRRKGFDQRQKAILLEAPSLEAESYEVEPAPHPAPVPLDDEIPF